MRIRFAGIVLLLAVGYVPTLSATPLGNLTIGICSLPGAGVTIHGAASATPNFIDWVPPTGGGNGCMISGAGTLVTYVGGGPLVNAVTGTIKDIALAGGAVVDFMTFSGNPNLHFDLTGLGPGPANTICASTLDQNAPACSISTGTPFKLSATTTGTELILSTFGIARDGSAGISQWLGNYSLSFPDVTPAQIQSALLSGTAVPGFCIAGSCTSTFSGAFTVKISQVPEPVALPLIGAGLLAVAALRRRWKA